VTDGVFDEPHGAGRPVTRRAAILSARLGVVQAVLLLAAYWLLAQAPEADASQQEFIEFYNSGKRNLILAAGLYLMPFAGIGFLWFAVVLRMWMKTTAGEDALLSNIQLVSAIIYIALFFASAAASSIVALTYDMGSATVATIPNRQFPRYGSALLLVFAMRMAAMFVFTTSSLGKRHDALPRWFVYSGFVVGAFLLLSFTLSAWLILVFPVWILVLSAILLFKARAIPNDEPTPEAATA
jgi:hypothetical protein